MRQTPHSKQITVFCVSTIWSLSSARDSPDNTRKCQISPASNKLPSTGIAWTFHPCKEPDQAMSRKIL
ncbi:hypothetical protein ACFX2K_001227 [Malus domestica]